MANWTPDTIDGNLYIWDEAEEDGEEDIEVEAEVTLEYDFEPYEAPSRYSPGGGGLCGAWVVKVHSVTMNGEELEGWEFQAAARAVERWAEENENDINETCEEALEESWNDYEPDPPDDFDDCPQYYDGTGTY